MGFGKRAGLTLEVYNCCGGESLECTPWNAENAAKEAGESIKQDTTSGGGEAVRKQSLM